MSTVREAFTIARSLLGDDAGVQWTDATLMPKLIQAHGEMVSKLALNGVPSIREMSVAVTITALATTMGASQPSSLIKPIKMSEKTPGEDVSRYILMTKHDFLPEVVPSTILRYWSYNEELIQFIGATADRDVKLYYEARLTSPAKITDTLVIPLSETYLGPRIVALCMSRSKQVGGNRDLFESASKMAEENLSMIVRTEVKGEQNLPVRRRPFSYQMKRGRMRF